MKLRLCFFMLALGICGAVVQGCDDNDDNLDVLDKLQAAFSQKYPEASPKWKIITLRISRTRIMQPRPGLLPMPFG